MLATTTYIQEEQRLAEMDQLWNGNTKCFSSYMVSYLGQVR